MLRRELAISFLVVFCILASIPVVLCVGSPPIIYIAGDGSGDYNCAGKSDQVQINQALQFVANNPEYTTVHLKGPFTYVIDDTVLIGSNTTLEGDSTAVIKLADHAGWPTMKPLIQQMSNSGDSNITVRGFEVNGNYVGNSEIALGGGFYNVMYFTYSNNIKVYNMYMHDGTGDGLRTNKVKNVQFYNNTIYKLGHDGLFAIRSENVEAWNNRITCRTNSALRIWNSNNVKFHDNLIDSFYHWSAGGPGIQIEKNDSIMDNIEIYNNVIHDTYGPGIWIITHDTTSTFQDQAKNIHIHHNIFYNTGTNPNITWVGGIIASGFNDTLIENNVFDGCFGAAIAHMFSADYSPNGGFTTIIRNNVIVNTQKRTKYPAGTGCGIANYLPDTHYFVMDNDCLFNNSGGDYKNCTSTTDIYVNPLVADLISHDYHLQSTVGRWDGKTWVKDNVSSLCIDAGYRYSDYSKEPEPNGNRINIGPDGNTKYASKSESELLLTFPTANFSSNVTGGIVPLTVKFTDLSNNTTAWKWDFGDRSNSTEPSPTHTYSTARNYTVNLTASNENGTNSKLTTIAVQKAIPTITWSNPADITYGTALSSTQLNAEASVPGTFTYALADGTPIVAGTVLSTGQHKLCIDFTPTDTASYSGTSANVTVNVLKMIPVITWSKPADIVYGTALGRIQLNASAPISGTFVYTPEAGTILSVGTQTLHVDFTPNDVANYTIASKNATINVSEKPIFPSADFSTNVTNGTAPITVQFTDLSKNATSRTWKFGDGSNSTEPNPMHTYSAAGNYTAILTVGNSNGTDSMTRNIRVVKKEIITNLSNKYSNRLREASPENIYLNSSFIDVGGMSGVGRYRDVIWFDLSGYTSAIKINNAALSLIWYYPNNSRLNDTVIEIYRPASTWNSSYVSWNKRDNNIAWNNTGGDWYDKNGILQGNAPYATLTLKASSLPSNSYCEFDVTDLVREYASNKYSNTGFLIKARTESGNYVAFYSSNCKLSLSTSILPVANFSSNVTMGNVPLSVQFTDLSKNATGWNWDFGDGSKSTESSPIHTYSTAGNYTVNLTASNENGMNSMTRKISVVKKEMISNLSGIYNNRLREVSPENIYSNSSFTDVGGMSGVGRYRDVIWFDLNKYTSDTQISNATLSLFWYYPNNSRVRDTVIEIYRPASTWNSSFTSWNKRNTGIAWNNPGGDWYDNNGVLQGNIPYATITLRASDLPINNYCEFNVTSIVREYVSGKYSNTGFFIKARTESDNYVAFYSIQCGNVSEVPKLKLVYS